MHSVGMPILFMFFVLTGMLFSVVGSFIFLIAAFRQHVLWGLAVLFLPVAPLVFLIVHWDDAKKGFLLQLIGVVVVLAGMGVVFSQGGEEFIESSSTPLPSEFRETITRELRRVAPRAPEPASDEGLEGDYVGLTIKQVTRILGAPKVRAQSDGQTVLLYPGLELTSRDGETISHQGKPAGG